MPTLVMLTASCLPLGARATSNSTTSPTCKPTPAADTCFLPRRIVPAKRVDVAKPHPSWKLLTVPRTCCPTHALCSFTTVWTLTALLRPSVGLVASSKVTSSPGRSSPSLHWGLSLSPKYREPSKLGESIRPQPRLKLLTWPVKMELLPLLSLSCLVAFMARAWLLGPPEVSSKDTVSPTLRSMLAMAGLSFKCRNTSPSTPSAVTKPHWPLKDFTVPV
mmetsp:Transcript_95021/g.297164  ORF Transcript_95021/g.297164 Transcript_95021/m.297164 type:complete len:219 (+) Transcript_95021:939-1595(+)